MKMRRGRRRFLALMIVCALLAPMAAPAAALGTRLPMAGEEEELSLWDLPFEQGVQGEEAAADSSAPAGEAVTSAPAVSDAEEPNAESAAPAEEEAPAQEQAPVQEPESFPQVTVPAEWYDIVNVGFNNKSLYLRSGPSTSSSVLLLPFATERANVRETMDNGWSRVVVRGVEGFLPTSTVKQNNYPFYMARDYTIGGVELKENQVILARSRTADNVYDCYLEGNLSISIPVNGALLLTPEQYYEKNKDKFVSTLIGREESYYSLGSANWGRNVNLELGCKSVDGKIVLPASYFSWCQHGGSGSAADGYQIATVFSSTGYGYGGGLCQVTTTLASAANHAKMYLAEVYPHSQPITYLRPGMTEASIWRNGDIRYQHDFAFFNNRYAPIQIRMKAENGVVTAELYELTLPARQEGEADPVA